MVRARKTPPQVPGNPQAQYPRQPVRSPTGQQYGRAQATEQAQRAMPLPQTNRQPVLPPRAPVRDAQSDFVQALEDAKAMRFEETPLNAETALRDEPITAGLPIGAGPGPEVLGMRQVSPPVAEALGRLAQATGDPALADLAMIAARQNV